MKLLRPHIPIGVRITVAQRQLKIMHGFVADQDKDEPNEVYLDRLLGHLASYLYKGGIFYPLQLDHDPALTNRKFSERTGKYKPDANDPRYLIYRTKDEHDIKTRVRGDGAQLSDLALRRKFKRIDKRVKAGKRAKPKKSYWWERSPS